ncbi:hypothetical protein CANARDRAFT_29027 [[Candida] arabinofermentans NRRL YB-2248]|uniref:SH3 domain-containing protein n=1 Tax=[Candida] arabinofermentans NRRL YB-2248 TaxID=983967 RepID=A0A1E4SYA2_9ASCO|nr:hypothetical protein CANARDRAFT_29027 [[Candida] arabinofermentans NRRL YB-2248]
MSIPYSAIAKFPYTPEAENASDDLGFEAGQIITVTEIVDDDWLFGTYKDTDTDELKSGYFPRGFVQQVDDSKEEEVQQPPAPKPEPVSAPAPVSAQLEPQFSTPANKEVKKEISKGSPSQSTESTAFGVTHGDAAEAAFKSKLSSFNVTSTPPLPGHIPSEVKYNNGLSYGKASPHSSYIPPPITKSPYDSKKSATPANAPPREVISESTHVEAEEVEAPRLTLRERMKLLEQRQKEEQEAMEQALKRKQDKKQHKKAAVTHSSSTGPPPIPTASTGGSLAPATTGGSITTKGSSIMVEEEYTGGNQQDLIEQQEEDDEDQGAVDRTYERTSHDNQNDEAEKPVEANIEDADDVDDEDNDENEDEDDDDDDEEEEDEDDEELKRRRLRERMAKLSGGMGMMGMMGMGFPMGAPPAKAEKQKKKILKTKSQEEGEEPLPSQTAIPMPGLAIAGLPQVQPPVALSKPTDSYDDEAEEKSLDGSNPATEPNPIPTSASTHLAENEEDEVEGLESVADESYVSDLTSPEGESHPYRSIPSSPTIPRVSSTHHTIKTNADNTSTIENIQSQPPTIPKSPPPIAAPEDIVFSEDSDSHIAISSITKESDSYVDSSDEEIVTGYEADEDTETNAPVASSPPQSKSIAPPIPSSPPRPTSVAPPPIPAIPHTTRMDDPKTPTKTMSVPAVPPPVPSHVPAVPVQTAPPPIPSSSPTYNRAPPPPPPSATLPPVPRASTTSTIEPHHSETFSHERKASRSATHHHHTNPPPPPPPPVGAPAPVPVPVTSQLERSLDLTAAPVPLPVSTTGSTVHSGEIVVGRSSVDLDFGRRSLEIPEISKSSSAWWLTSDLPPELANSRDIYFEVDSREVNKRHGRVVLYRDYYIVNQDYSIKIWEVSYDVANPAKLLSFAESLVAKPHVNTDYLIKCSKKYGASAFQLASSVLGSTGKVQDELIYWIFKQLSRSALMKIGTKTFGATIYKNNNNMEISQTEEFRPGDVLVVLKGKFEGHSTGLMHKSKSAELGYGGRPYVSIISGYDATKKKIRVIEQSSKGIQANGYKLGDFKSGKIRVFRIVGRDYIGW